MPDCPQSQPSLPGAILRTLLAGLVLTGLAFGSDDTTPPELKSLRFTPDTIDTSRSVAEVTLSFSVTDDASGATYFEVTFMDPSGGLRRTASTKFAPTLAATNSVKITFPRFSDSGTWTLSQVFLSDAAGNTLSLDADDINGRGIPSRLEVRSAKDTISPKLTALNFPAEIDTSTGPAVVKVNYAATDDLSGVSYFELSFSSPSGSIKNASAKFEPAESVSSSVGLTFPVLSEPGEWTLSTVFVADAAGNTLVLNAADVSTLGFRTALQVKSAPDTKSPELSSIRLSLEVIDTSQEEVTVTLELKATDDLSGVKSIEAAFTGPSGEMGPKGSLLYSPARKEVADSVKITFPKSSERGAWTLSTLIISDEAGNTLVLSPDVLASKVGLLQVR
jgi:hypothetical protein